MATGTAAPAPITGFVELPRFVAKTTWSVKPPLLTGVKSTTTFVELRVATVNGLPETIENGTPPTAAVPLRVDPKVWARIRARNKRLRSVGAALV